MLAAKDPRYRIGIDVGGTFTKAALLDDSSHAVVARASVHTTHAHVRGVAAGVIEVFRAVLEQSGVAPCDVVFLAHSTTQATNALLEGDVANVGVIGIAGKAAAKLAEPQVKVAPIDLGSGRMLATFNRFCPSEQLTEAVARDVVEALKAEGADVIVASAAFGVDDTGAEDLIRSVAAAQGLPTTCGHEITRLYGLAVRTRTAVINASILPRMIATADMTERSVREAGITAPLMIMRSDGGVMDVREMRRRPAMTMLSGPAASIAGALMHVRMSDGIYFEVGGTSTNLGVIQGGRPSIAYARVGGHDTYLTSLDVRVIGIAGGSLIRARDSAVIDVGPRSAHIAGLPYAAFAPPGSFDRDAALAFISPQGGEPDHIAIRAQDGKRYALTTTCAANVLGTAKAGMHCFAGSLSARDAFAPFARYLGCDVDTAARIVLDRAADKIVPVIESLIHQYKLEPDQRTLIGVGGGAGALIPIVAERMGLRSEIAPDAEIISSIGSALAMVREVIERIIPHPTPEDIQRVRQEAIDAVAALGAHRETIEVTVDIDRLTQRVRASASGAAEMRARGTDGAIHETEARQIAARSLGVSSGALSLAETDGLRVYHVQGDAHGPVRVIDAAGTLRVQRGHARVVATTVGGCLSAIRAALSAPADAVGLYALVRHRLLDLTGVSDPAQVTALAKQDLAGEAPSTRAVLVVISREATRD